MKKLYLTLLVAMISSFSIKGMYYKNILEQFVENKQTFIEREKNKFMRKSGLSEEVAEKEAQEKYRKEVKELFELYSKNNA